MIQIPDLGQVARRQYGGSAPRETVNVSSRESASWRAVIMPVPTVWPALMQMLLSEPA